MNRPTPTLFFLLLATLLANPSNAADKKKSTKPKFKAADVEFFEKQVRPILARRCYSCHSTKSKKLQGKLFLDSRAGVLKGGETGPAIKPGDPKNSRLIDAINYGVIQMPPKSKLPAKEIAILTRWIKIGAPWSKESAKLTKLAKTFNLQARRSSHWAWRKIGNPQPPQVKGDGWVRDPLDRFILARLEAKGLQPNGDANRSTWIRRVYFDLIGLPPSPKRVRDFVLDKSPEAFEKVVNEVLKSKHFGERWARHWMDLVRYAETFGHEFDYPVRHAHRYRDYLIRAFNADVPFNDFIVEHIAGDLIRKPRRHPKDKFNESVLGTGFWMLGEMTHSPVDVRDDEARRIDNQLDVMGKTFLGLTIGCARCHDHKFDAISTRDYYALVGFLQSSHRANRYLDPLGKIQSTMDELDRVRKEADESMKRLPSGMDDLAKYLVASRAVLLKDPNAAGSSAQKIEAEKLKVTKTTSGKVQRQGGFSLFSGKQQLWWINSKIGGKIDLQLAVPRDGTYSLMLQFVKSFDYGIVQVLLDGKKLGKPVDLYNRTVIHAPPQQFAKLTLSKGNHTLTLQVVGRNKRAKPQHMVGLDFLRLAASGDSGADKVIKEVAGKLELDPGKLKRWIQLVLSKKTAAADSPLNLWRRLSRVPTKEFAQEVAKHRKRINREQKEAKQSKVFADFSKMSTKRWFATGHAFQDAKTGFGRWNGRSRLLKFVQPGQVDSAQRSGKLHGVLRSPTFTLTHKFIDYHIAAQGAEIRVIIDGYTMDAFNGLLFGGAKLRANTGGRFTWIRQGGDVSRYIGHRAHIELIDHGNGFIALDQIRFTNGARPKPQSVIANRALKKAATPVGIAREIERLLTNVGRGWIDGKAQVEHTAIRNLMLEYGLIDSRPIAETIADAKRSSDNIDRGLPGPIHAMGISDGSPENEFVFVRGNHKTPGPRVERRFLEALGGRLHKSRHDEGSGRLSLARQIASERNPLTSRVIVNRVWHHLTGRGIVPSVDNFGVLGQLPSHPQLLDHLAHTFTRDGWSLKRLMKRIVLSSTYRMSSRPSAAGTKADPDNKLLHRMRIRRLQGEAIRDAILAISGRLDAKMYGPSVPVHVTSHMQGRGRPRRNGPIDGAGRRSLYIEVRRNFLSPMMLAFDTPIPFNTMGRRNVSNVPAQALILMNDPLVSSQARLWGQKVAKQPGGIYTKTVSIYMQAFSRPPTKVEERAAYDFILQQIKERKLSSKDGPRDPQIWGDLCHVIFNVKEFIFLR